MRTDSAILRVLCLAVIGFLMVVMPHAPRAQESVVYKVTKISVDMRASDAVTAKNEALAFAKRKALHTVFRRIAPFNSFDRFPVVKAAAVDDLLEGWSVRKEANSRTRYLATLDFSFGPDEVRKLLSAKGIPVTDQQAGQIAVLPVYIHKGKIDHTGRDPWRAAWNGLDLRHAVVPVRLAQTGPSFTMEALSNLLGGDVKKFVELRDKLKAEKLVLAIAEPTADGLSLTTRLFGVDRVGSVSLSRNEPVYRSDMKSASGRAAEIFLGVFEGRWKLVQLPAGEDGTDAAPAVVNLVVEFAGMRQWRDIRARLVKVPGVNEIDVKSLSARTAQVALQFPGGVERLSRALPPHGLSLNGAGESWILRSN